MTLQEPVVDQRNAGSRDVASAPEPLAALRSAVAHAVLAPSEHNTQPWLFAIREDALWLYADRTRALPVVDPVDQKLVMSCGAALFNARLALRHAGWEVRVDLLPDPRDHDLLAVARLGGARPPTPAEATLFQAILSRRTNRGAFRNRLPPQALLEELERAAEEEGAALRVIGARRDRELLAELIAEGDRIQNRSKAFRRELAAWIHPNRGRSRDGIPGAALGVGDLASWVGPLVVRTFDRGGGQAARDRQLALGSPVLAVLTTEHDSTAAWLHAGQALERVLLHATAAGLSASFLNQPVEVPELRTRLLLAFGLETWPHVVLRLGYGGEAPATPRRALAEVLLD